MYTLPNVKLLYNFFFVVIRELVEAPKGFPKLFLKYELLIILFFLSRIVIILLVVPYINGMDTSSIHMNSQIKISSETNYGSFQDT